MNPCWRYEEILPRTVSLCVGLAIAILLGIPFSAAAQPCLGDCDSDNRVSVAELIRGVGFALGRETPQRCAGFDLDVDGSVGISELVGAVANALRGCGSAAEATEVFASVGRKYRTGRFVRWLAIGDLDGDGVPDLVAALASFDQPLGLAILRGRPDGSFGQASVIREGEVGALPVILADLDRDGWLDLVTGAESVEILFNDGADSPFDSSMQLAVMGALDDFAVGDVDGDGYDDIAAVASLTSGTLGERAVGVYRNAGGRRFLAPALTSLPPQQFTIIKGLGLRLARVDGDDLLDLILPAAPRTVLGFSLGDGLFRVEQPLGLEQYLFDVVSVGHVDGDDLADMIVSTPSGGTERHPRIARLNRGDGSFEAVKFQGANIAELSTTLADIDGDGVTDLISAGGRLVVSASGVSAEGGGVEVMGGVDGRSFRAPSLLSKAVVSNVVTADLNKDGWLDVITGSSAHVTTLLTSDRGNSRFLDLGKTDAVWPPKVEAVALLPGNEILVVRREIAAPFQVQWSLVTVGASEDRSLRVLSTVETVEIEVERGIAVARVDEDEYPDLLVASVHWIYLVRGVSGGGWEPSGMRVWETSERIRRFHAADIDSDGHVDLTVNQQSDRFAIRVLLGNGDGTFALREEVITAHARSGLADIDGDGNQDILTTRLAQGEGEVLRIHAGRGDGTFGDPIESIGWNSFGFGGIDSGDLDDDGHTDLFLTRRESDDGEALFVLYGDGEGGFEEAGLLPRVVAVDAFSLADLNGDGTKEVVVITSDGLEQNLVVLPGEGNRRFGEPRLYDAGVAGGLAVADFDQDGFQDLALADRGSNVLPVIFGGEWLQPDIP